MSPRTLLLSLALIALAATVPHFTAGAPATPSAAATAAAQDGEEFSRCATRPVSAAEAEEIRESLRQFRAARSASAEAASALVYIPVYVHVIKKGEGQGDGDVPETAIEEQVNVLNKSYAGETGGAQTRFRFTLAGVDRTVNAAWFNAGPGTAAEREMKNVLREGGADALNLYTNLPSGSLLGWATWPHDYTGNPKNDGVVIRYTTLPGGKSPFDGGDTATHEVGHWLGLYHTFYPWEETSNGCTLTNDEVDDTPAEASPSSGCQVGRDSCADLPGADPVENFMDYSDDDCMYRFTDGQAARMDATYAMHREARVIDSLTFSAEPVTGGQAVLALIKLTSPAPSTGTLVYLSSSDPAAVPVPASAKIPAGSSGRTFTLSTKPVAARETVSVYAGFVRGESRQSKLTVVPPTLAGFAVGPSSVTGSCQTATGTVTLGGRAPAGGLRINLNNNNPPAAGVPEGVTVQGGQQYATFTISAAQVATKQTAAVTAVPDWPDSGASISRTLTVLPNAIKSLTLAPNPAPASSAVAGVVSLACPAPAGGASVSLSSSAAGVAQPAAPSLTIPAGSDSAAFVVTAKDVAAASSALITARAGDSKKNAQLTVDPSITLAAAELLPYRAPGYRYLVLNPGSPPPQDYERPDFDDSAWGTGDASFGFTVGYCPIHASDKTAWPLNTGLLVRRVLDVPAGASNLRVMVAVDNDVVDIFFNGVRISTPVSHEECPTLDNYQFAVPQSLVRVGQNVISYRLLDRGGESFFDTRVVADVTRGNSVWPMSGHDPQRTGLSPFLGPSVVTRGPQWVFATGAAVKGDIVVSAEGNVYFASDKLYALKPDGTAHAAPAPGDFLTSPAIDDRNGYVYVAASSPSSGFDLLRYDKQLQNATAVFHGGPPPFGGGVSSPVISGDGTVYFSYGRFPGTTIAVGQANWSAPVCPFELPTLVGYLSGVGGPALGVDGSLYVMCPAQALYRLKAQDGSPIASTPFDRNAVEPMVDNNGHVRSGNMAFGGAIFYGTYTEWNADLTVAHDSPWDYTTSRATLMPGGSTVRWGYAFDEVVLSRRGSGVWDVSLTLPEKFTSLPTADADGKIFIGARTQMLCLRQSDGGVMWSQAVSAPVTTQPAISRGGVVYVGTSDGKIYAF